MKILIFPLLECQRLHVTRKYIGKTKSGISTGTLHDEKMTLGMGYYFDDSKTKTDKATTILYAPAFNVPGYDYLRFEYMKKTLASFDIFSPIL